MIGVDTSIIYIYLGLMVAIGSIFIIEPLWPGLAVSVVTFSLLQTRGVSAP